MKVGSRGSVPSALSNHDLLLATRGLVGRTNATTCELIAHLAEVDSRRLYLEQAQPSMFAWCVAELGCSEDVACNWIAVARASRRYPAVLDALRDGKVHLTGLRMLAPHLTDEGHQSLLAEATGRSKREMEELVASIAPRPAVPASIRKLPAAREAGAKKGGSAGGGLGLLDPNGPADGADAKAALPDTEAAAAPAAEGGKEEPNRQASELLSSARPGSSAATPQPPRRANAPGRVEPLSDEAYKVTFTASRRLRDKIRQAQDLLGHQVLGGDLAEIVERGLDLLMEDVRKKRFAVRRKPRAKKTKREESKSPAAGRRQESPADEPELEALKPGAVHPAAVQPEALEPEARAAEIPASGGVTRRSRYIPADVRRTVFERDGGRCTYVDERGKRCPETRRLELDHANGFARGAPHTVDAIRLRCRPHNGWGAEQMYGRVFMEEKRVAKVSAPARVNSTSLAEDSKQSRGRAA